MAIQGKVGALTAPQNSEGTFPDVRLTRDAAQTVSDSHGRFFDAAMREALYSGGMTLTSISNATFSTGTVGNTATPIVGVYNPLNSGVILNVLQATLCVVVTAATNTGAGAFVWCTSSGNNGITTGNAPFNRKFGTAGSRAKDMCGVALTGLTNNLATKFGSALGGGSLANFSFVGTAAGQATPQYTAVENFDGSVLIPEGCVLGLFCTTNAPVAHSAASSILWEEIPAQF